MTPVGVDLEQPRKAVNLKAEHDPATVGRVGTDVGVDPTLVMRHKTQMRSIWADGHDVSRDSGG